MDRPSYRLIAIDIDGTLLTPDKRISADTFAVLEQVHAQGVQIMLCTGRTRHKALEVTSGIPFDHLLALHNGATIVHAPSGEVLERHTLPAEQVRQALTFLCEHDFQPTVYVYGEPQCCLLYEPDSVNEGTQMFLSSKQRLLQPCHDIHACLGDEVIHIVAVDGRERVLWALDQLRCQLTEATVLTSGGFYEGRFWFLEILSEHASKSEAIATIARQHGIDQEQVLAIGDNYNDLDMIEYAGLGVAMANAPEEIQAVADVVTASNGNDGVAKALRRYVLV